LELLWSLVLGAWCFARWRLKIRMPDISEGRGRGAIVDARRLTGMWQINDFACLENFHAFCVDFTPAFIIRRHKTFTTPLPATDTAGRGVC
jgi:hypothetical protein